MSFDRDLWSDVFDRNAIPKFQCPTCEKGHLLIDKETFIVRQTAYSIAAHGEEGWEPDWETERFTALLHCDIPACGEIVAMQGDTTVIEYMDEEFGWGLTTVLRPRALFPAPPIIKLPKELPNHVASHVIDTFQLYWVDLSACANRLRISVEFLLDYFKVPRDGLDKKGKVIRLDLNGRIALFEKQEPEHAMTLTALRMIGNLGSHGEEIKKEAILDVYELYEDCLAELCGQRKKRLETLRKKIIDTKGKY